MKNAVRNKERGMGLIEIVIVVAVLSISIMGVGELMALSQRSRERSQNQKEASILAGEAMEALVSLKRQNWSTNIGNQTPGQNYYIARSSSPPYSWQVLSSDPGALYGKPQNFHRSIVFSRVYRDANDTIASSGTEDTNMRKATVTMTWTERSAIRSQSSETYIANMQ